MPPLHRPCRWTSDACYVEQLDVPGRLAVRAGRHPDPGKDREQPPFCLPAQSTLPSTRCCADSGVPAAGAERDPATGAAGATQVADTVPTVEPERGGGQATRTCGLQSDRTCSGRSGSAVAKTIITGSKRLQRCREFCAAHAKSRCCHYSFAYGFCSAYAEPGVEPLAYHYHYAGPCSDGATARWPSDSQPAPPGTTAAPSTATPSTPALALRGKGKGAKAAKEGKVKRGRRARHRL